MKTTSPSLTSLSASELAGLIARGEISSVETVEAHIEQIEKVNPSLNAIVFKRYAAARAEARKADESRIKGEPSGPLHGVPLTIKESLDLVDSPSSFGVPSRSNILAAQDDLYVGRLRRAGGIILGKTNASQLLMFVETDNPLYGRTNNPWNLERSPGGSSGGQAAIIAAGGVPMGLGTDIGGSIRIPATSCGIAGFKPTAGRCPDAGRYSVPIGEQAIVSQVGVLARSVSDIELGLEIINNGPNPGDLPAQPLGNPAQVDLSKLRVGFYSDDGTFKVAPAVARAVKEAAQVLESQGAAVVPWSPPDVREAVDLFFGILSADGAKSFRQTLGSAKRDPRIADIIGAAGSSRRKIGLLVFLLGLLGQPGTQALIKNYGYKDTWHYWQLVEAQMDYRQRFREALNRASGGPLDLIICPAFALPALVHGASRDLVLAGGYTSLYNLLGYPTGIVPFTKVRPGEEVGRPASKDKMEQAAYRTELGSAGLPIGVQVVARPWQEHQALAAMRCLEQIMSSHPEYPKTA